MRILMIGGTGYIGSEVVRGAVAAGHEVQVLSRSEASDRKLDKAAVGIVRGTTEDLDLVVSEASAADAVVYLAIPGVTGASHADVAAIRGILDAHEHTDKSFVLTSGLAVYAGTAAAVVTPDTPTDDAVPAQMWRAELERTVLDANARGVKATVIRPAIVYGGNGVSPVIAGYLGHVASGGVPFYIGSGQNLIATVHVRDLARVYLNVAEAESPGRSVNVATGAILGFDLAQAVKELTKSGKEAASFDAGQAVAAMGPAGALLGVDLRISTWSLVRDFGPGLLEPTLLQALAAHDVPIR